MRNIKDINLDEFEPGLVRTLIEQLQAIEAKREAEQQVKFTAAVELRWGKYGSAVVYRCHECEAVLRLSGISISEKGFVHPGRCFVCGADPGEAFLFGWDSPFHNPVHSRNPERV